MPSPGPRQTLELGQDCLRHVRRGHCGSRERQGAGGLDSPDLFQADIRHPGHRVRVHGGPTPVRVVANGINMSGESGDDSRRTITRGYQQGHGRCLAPAATPSTSRPEIRVRDGREERPTATNSGLPLAKSTHTTPLSPARAARHLPLRHSARSRSGGSVHRDREHSWSRGRRKQSRGRAGARPLDENPDKGSKSRALDQHSGAERQRSSPGATPSGNPRSTVD